MAAALLSRCSFAVRSTPRAEVHAAGRCLVAPAVQSHHQAVLRSSPVLPARGICRGYATESEHEPAATLKDALKAEIDFELDNPSEVENLPSQPPSPWTLTESAGDSKLELRRPFNDEDIVVTVIADEASQDEPGTPDQETPLDPAEQRNFDDLDVGIVAEAKIVRNDLALDFNFRTDGTYIQVLDVSFGHPEKTERDDNDTTYAGPRYEELDEAVQGAFDGYLEKRGITAEFGEYLMKLTEDKEQREYLNWLQKVHEHFA